jgi:hypothetical protein
VRPGSQGLRECRIGSEDIPHPTDQLSRGQVEVRHVVQQAEYSDPTSAGSPRSNGERSRQM